MIRKDQSDVIYKTVNAKYKAVVNHIENLHKEGQPVLVGTVSIEVSEAISRMLGSKNHPPLKFSTQSITNAKRKSSPVPENTVR